MNYIRFNDDPKGDVKVISEKGDVKWFPQHIAEDSRLMKDSGFKIVEAPLKAEPKIDPPGDNKKEGSTVANATEAKRQGETKTK